MFYTGAGRTTKGIGNGFIVSGRLTALHLDVTIGMRPVFRATTNLAMSYMTTVTVVSPCSPVMVLFIDITTSRTFPSVLASVLQIINGAPVMRSDCRFFAGIVFCNGISEGSANGWCVSVLAVAFVI